MKFSAQWGPRSEQQRNRLRLQDRATYGLSYIGLMDAHHERLRVRNVLTMRSEERAIAACEGTIESAPYFSVDQVTSAREAKNVAQRVLGRAGRGDAS